MEQVPEIIKSPEAASVSPGNNWRSKLPAVFLGAVILVIIVELIWGAQVFLADKKAVVLETNPKIIEDISPQLIVQTPKMHYKPGENIPVTIKVVTAGKPSDSTDVILRFDPNVLEASGSGFINLGRIYQEYPVADFDNRAGAVQLSGTTPPDGEGFSGIGYLATLNFKAKSAGVTSIAIDYQKGSTAESNIVLSGSNQDILSGVKNADITISDNPSPENQNSEQSSCNGFFQYCQIGDKTGKQFCQSGRVINNQCSFDPEVTVSCSECQLQ